MRNKFFVRSMTVLLAFTLAGCGNKTATDTSPKENINIDVVEQEIPESTDIPEVHETTPAPTFLEEIIETTATPIETPIITERPSEPAPVATALPTEVPRVPTAEPTKEPSLADEMGLTEQQLNSFSMLYYLAITAEEIRVSKDNRLILEDIYTSLLNDINPSSIDETTQEHLKTLRDTIKEYINISVKRDRLQYIYNQEKAQSIRNVVPQPLTVNIMKKSLNWKELAVGVGYTAIQSYDNYKKSTEAIENKFLISGWELDEKEEEVMRKNRERAFDYMVDMVQEYGIDGKLTLNEKAIMTFAEICENDAIYQKILRLESEEETYKLLGNYWLELADAYYETEQYVECLECIDKYNDLAVDIYRKDYNYVQILPKVIVAVKKVYWGFSYMEKLELYANDIIENTDIDEWALRYFAAQVYLDLYTKSSNQEYLDNAYQIACENVGILLTEQKKLNETYLQDIEPLKIKEPEYRFLTEDEKKKKEQEYKEEKKQLKEYNKLLEEERKTELPPLYQPLILNCDLLFALAEEKQISDVEKERIENLLETKSNGVFISKLVNDKYSFKTEEEKYHIEFEKDEIIIPVDLLSEGVKIVVYATDNYRSTTFDDCIVVEVEREGESLNSFWARVTSKKMQNYEWTVNSQVTVRIYNGIDDNPIEFYYEVKDYKDNFIGADKVVFEKR